MHSLILQGGGEPYHVPFLAHSRVPFSLPANVPDAVVVSSARTLQYWDGCRDFILKHDIPVYAIGKKTSQRLLDVGIQALLADGSGDSLIQKVVQDRVSSFVHIGAEQVSKNLHEALMSSVVPFTRIIVYKSTAHPAFCVPSNIDVGCLNSERCARIWAQNTTCIPVVCLGQSTQKEALRLGLSVLGVASIPAREELARVALSSQHEYD